MVSAIRNSVLGIALIIITFLGAPACATIHFASGSAKGVDYPADLERILLNGMGDQFIQGMSVVYIERGETVLKKGFGQTDPGGETGVRTDSIFALGSVTKLFTGISIMQLVERGYIDLDAHPSRYLKDFRIQKDSASSKLTVRSMLTHHSGLPSDYMRNFSSANVPPPASYIKSDDLPRLLQAESLSHPPGTVFSYSNLSYSLLGLIVERVSGQELNEYMRQNIFRPLNMENTSIALTPAIRRRMVRAKTPNGDSVIALPYIRDTAAGSITTTADDMERFLQALIRGGSPILKKETLSAMLAVQNKGVFLDGSFLIGISFWRLDLFKDQPPYFGHGGDISPFQALLLFSQEDKGGIVLLSAGAEESSMGLGKIARKILARSIEYRGKSTPTLLAKDRRMERPPAEDLRFAGYYASPFGIVNIEAAGGELYMNFMDYPLKLVPDADGVYRLEADLFHIFSLSLDSLQNLRVRFAERDGEKAVFMDAAGMYMGPATPLQKGEIDPAWRSLTGEYVPAEEEIFPPFKELTLDIDDDTGVLMMGLRINENLGMDRTLRFPLKTVSDSSAVLQGYGRNMGEQIHLIKNDGRPVIRIQGILFRRKE